MGLSSDVDLDWIGEEEGEVEEPVEEEGRIGAGFRLGLEVNLVGLVVGVGVDAEELDGFT